MKAAVWHGYKDVRISEVEAPEINEGEVLIEVSWAGICGTDRHEYVGPNFIPTTKPHRLTGKTAPLIMGHEFSGIITKTGKNVTGWKVGDRVTANGTLCCKTCEMCKSGRYNVCEKLGFVGVGRDGTFADYVAIDAERLFKIPDNVTLKQAAVAEPIACGLHATKLMGGTKDKNVLVIGPGIIGIGCFLAAKLSGAKKIIVSGIGEERRELIEKYGGIYADTSKTDLNEVLAEEFGGLADTVYECVGIQPTLNSSIASLKPGGSLMVMGVFEKPPVFPMNDFQEGERKLYTSQAHVDEIGLALEHISKGDIDADELVTREVTLDTLVEDGFEELIANGPKHIKVLIKING